MYGSERVQTWSEHKAEDITQNKKYEIVWDLIIQWDSLIEAGREDIMVDKRNKKENRAYRYCNTRGCKGICGKELNILNRSDY